MLRTQWSAVIFITSLMAVASGCVSPWIYKELEDKHIHQTTVLSAAERQIALDQSEIAALRKQLATEQRTNDMARRDLADVKRQVLKVSHDLANSAKHQADKFRVLEEFQDMPNVIVTDAGSLLLEDGILFASGRRKLTTKGQAVLKNIAAELNSEKYGDQIIMIAGHTDSDKIRHSSKVYKDNWDLGAERAREVLLYLNTQGVTLDRMYLASFADTRPRAGGTKKSDDRRVEIILDDPF